MPRVHADLLRDGIQGVLYYKEGMEKADRAMIILDDPRAKHRRSRQIARSFARLGVPSLALAYCREAGLPLSPARLPLEYVRDAAFWLHRMGYEKVGVYGLSLGAVYALCAASHLPQIAFTVAVSPFDYVLEGRSVFGTPTNTSSHTFNGKDLPWLPWRKGVLRTISTSLMAGQLDTRFRYRDALRFAGGRSRIRVEKLHGPVLFITASEDTVWASDEAVMRMKARLMRSDFPYEVCHVQYHCGTHRMLPMKHIPARERILFANARHHIRKYRSARLHAARRTADFVRSV